MVMTDPKFANAAAGDLRLANGQPAIDQGVDRGVDTNGLARLFNGVAPDLGAFESP